MTIDLRQKKAPRVLDNIVFIGFNSSRADGVRRLPRRRARILGRAMKTIEFF